MRPPLELDDEELDEEDDDELSYSAQTQTRQSV